MSEGCLVKASLNVFAATFKYCRKCILGAHHFIVVTHGAIWSDRLV